MSNNDGNQGAGQKVGRDDTRWRSDEPFHSEVIRIARENRTLTFVAALLFLPLLAAALYYTAVLLFTPKHISVGVIAKTPDTQVMEALRTVLPKTKARVRLDIRIYDSPQAIITDMEQRRLDLGVLRSDLPLPGNSRSVVNLREISVAFVAPTSANIKDIRGLGGKPVLALSASNDGPNFAASLLRAAGVKDPAITATASSEEAAAALKSGKASAIAIVDSPERGYTRRLWRQNAFAGLKIEPVPIIEVDEIATANPGITQDKIPAKSISVKPEFPEEETIVLKASYLLLGRSDVDRSYVGSLAETLYSRRIEIARSAPSINSIKTIDNEYVTSSLIPVHDGALDYFRREQMSFYERYNEIIWLVIFYGGSVFSGIAWLGQGMFRSQRQRQRNLLREISEVLEKVEDARDEKELAELSREAEAIVAHCMTMAHHDELSQKRLAASSLGYAAIQSALRRKREELEEVRTAPDHARSMHAGEAA